VKKFAMPAHAAKTRLLVVANARHSTSYGCALRLDQARFGDLLGHAEFFHSLWAVATSDLALMAVNLAGGKWPGASSSTRHHRAKRWRTKHSLAWRLGAVN
jgi:hypothetical protein